ncbi:MAG: GNAT family N-acetyltransferase [Propionibacterium sp.]|nr:GNAT family N-acetyltransferase [Propionibacterium sp.]
MSRVIAPYQLETLPLDTPDDDPRWAFYVDLFNNAFLDARGSTEALAAFRKHRRADNAVLGMVTTEGPGLAGRQPVAGFTWAPIGLNAGAGIVQAMCVNVVAVRPTHRRKGLLRAMMQHHLQQARQGGLALAALTASEATIYGRFGFGVASRIVDWEIDIRRFAIRPDVTVAAGSLELVDPPSIKDIFEHISNSHQRAHRGAFSPLEMHRAKADGSWSKAEQGPSRKLRYLVHFDESGQPDGFAGFSHKGWEEAPSPTEVTAVCSPSPEIDRALWRGLASFDIVERLTYSSASPDDPLPESLVDSWAVTKKLTHDGVWLRILDMEKATVERGFESDGEAVVRVKDPMGFCDGTWQITVDGGRGAARRTALSPTVELGVDALARLWLGDATAVQLAQSGTIEGDQDAIAGFSQLFATAVGPANLTHF